VENVENGENGENGENVENGNLKYKNLCLMCQAEIFYMEVV